MGGIGPEKVTPKLCAITIKIMKRTKIILIDALTIEKKHQISNA